MLLSRFLACAALGFVSCAAQAQSPAPQVPASDVEWLQRIQVSARELDYSGLFAYQQGASMQSSRITHVFDGKGERERLEVLDGQPVEFLRKNDEIQCLLPRKRTVLVQTRSARDRFPGLMIGKAEKLAEHYEVSVEDEPERVADRDCRVITLKPRDDGRYGYRLCADIDSGLLLRAQTLSAEQEVLEQVSFLALQLGAEVDRKQLASPWKTADWKVVRTVMNPIKLAKMGWTVGEPAGFGKMMEVQRSIGGKPDVKQVILSDGLAAISVFIEPYSDTHPRQEGPGVRGATHVLGRRLGDHWITVLGEAPLATIRQVADSISHTPAAADK